MESIAAQMSSILSSLQSMKRQSAVALPSAGQGGQISGAEPGTGFEKTLQDALHTVWEAQKTATDAQKAYAVHAPGAPSLVEVMLAAQKSNVAFQELIGIRNELVGAYNTVMSMQV